MIVGLFQEHAEILWSNGMFAVNHSRCNCFLPRITLFIESEDEGFTTSKTKDYFGNSAMFVHNVVQSEKNAYCVAILLSKVLDRAKKIISIWHLLPGSGVGAKLPPVWPFVDSLPSQGNLYLDWEPKKQQLLSRCLATRDQWTCVKLFRSMKILAHNQNRTFRRNLVLTTFLGKTTRNTKMECRLEMCKLRQAYLGHFLLNQIPSTHPSHSKIWDLRMCFQLHIHFPSAGILLQLLWQL